MLPGITDALKGITKNVRQAFQDEEPLSLSLSEKTVGNFATGATPDWYRANGYPGIFAALGGGSQSWSGENVTMARALNHSVVWACDKLISETIGFLPLSLYRETDGKKAEALDHPMYSALKHSPNDEMTAMTFRESRTSNAVLGGNGYAQIIRRSGSGEGVQLLPLDPSQMAIDHDSTNRLVYIVKQGQNESKTYTVQAGKPQDIFHLRGHGSDGIRGYSVLSQAHQSIGTAIAVERNVGRFYAAGGRVPYVLEMEKKFMNDADYDKFRADWERTYSDAHKVPILENNMKYHQTGLSAVDSQMLESRVFSINEICRWFSVSPHLVGDLSKATFSNIENLALQFVKLTLNAWMVRWEQELWRCVLTPDEKSKGFFFRHDVDALLRGDFQSRVTGYSTLLQNGVNNINEIRNLEDWNPITGGDAHHIQLNMQDISGADADPGVPSVVRVGA